MIYRGYSWNPPTYRELLMVPPKHTPWIFSSPPRTNFRNPDTPQSSNRKKHTMVSVLFTHSVNLRRQKIKTEGGVGESMELNFWRLTNGMKLGFAYVSAYWSNDGPITGLESSKCIFQENFHIYFPKMNSEVFPNMHSPYWVFQWIQKPQGLKKKRFLTFRKPVHPGEEDR